jgi:hypothetical protein
MVVSPYFGRSAISRMHTSASRGAATHDQRTVFIGESGSSMWPEYPPWFSVDVHVARN